MSNPNLSSPYAAGYVMPAEWALHRTCYSAWPAHAYAWGPHLAAAQHEFCGFVRAFAANPRSELLTILVPDDQRELASAAVGDVPVRWQALAYGDIWLRDTGPIFLSGPDGRASVRFRFNGWGSKYVYPHDAEVAAALAAIGGGPDYACDFILEGGAIDVDGEGTCLTTRSCLLNENREAPSDPSVIERRLHDALGIERVIWLDGGLANDHTDGHVDNIARFVAPGVVVCMRAEDPGDPNAEVFAAVEAKLRSERDARGRALEVVSIPGPGRVLGADGQIAPASHMNFLIGNARVLMPAFGTPWTEPARAALQALFPQREVVAASARAILEGGGTFHCMTQQEPTA
jgi:agmatine deiminase